MMHDGSHTQMHYDIINNENGHIEKEVRKGEVR
jgi:hypothetical protein